LSYCLKSVHKFASGFSEVVVVIPDTSDLPLTVERLVKVREPGPSAESVTNHGTGYTFQQVVKMNADKDTTSDFVCHSHSDGMLRRPVTPKDLMLPSWIGSEFGEDVVAEIVLKPIWLMTPFKDILHSAKNLGAHVESMREFSGIDPEFEYMRRHSQVV